MLYCVYYIHTEIVVQPERKYINSMGDTPCNLFYFVSTLMFSKVNATSGLSLHLFHGMPFFRFVNLLQTVQQINYEILVQFSRYMLNRTLNSYHVFAFKNWFNTPASTSPPAFFSLVCSCSPKFQHNYSSPEDLQMYHFCVFQEKPIKFRGQRWNYNCKKLFSFTKQWPV